MDKLQNQVDCPYAFCAADQTMQQIINVVYGHAVDMLLRDVHVFIVNLIQDRLLLPCDCILALVSLATSV